jgi:hypothetical protein
MYMPLGQPLDFPLQLSDLFVLANELCEPPAYFLPDGVINPAQLNHFVQPDTRIPEIIDPRERQLPGQGRTGKSLSHPQLTPLHTAGQVDFALPVQKAHGSHLPQVHPDRVIGGYRSVEVLFGSGFRFPLVKIRLEIQMLVCYR